MAKYEIMVRRLGAQLEEMLTLLRYMANEMGYEPAEPEPEPEPESEDASEDEESEEEAEGE